MVIILVIFDDYWTTTTGDIPLSGTTSTVLSLHRQQQNCTTYALKERFGLIIISRILCIGIATRSEDRTTTKIVHLRIILRLQYKVQQYQYNSTTIEYCCNTDYSTPSISGVLELSIIREVCYVE
jgi:hypothetical protein